MPISREPSSRPTDDPDEALAAGACSVERNMATRLVLTMGRGDETVIVELCGCTPVNALAISAFQIVSEARSRPESAGSSADRLGAPSCSRSRDRFVSIGEPQSAPRSSSPGRGCARFADVSSAACRGEMRCPWRRSCSTEAGVPPVSATLHRTGLPAAPRRDFAIGR